MVNRQLEIIYILMNKSSVTAEELAAHFEVSTRTVYRDIDSLSMAGFPVYASRGKGGGIRLMERFILDRRLLTGEEQQRILAAMASLRETGAFQDEKILEKLQTFFRAESMEWVSIDFSDWSGRHGELFSRIKEAILGRHVMAFDYYGQRGQMTHREVEPVQLLFKEYTWYVRAFCRGRRAMRLFKVLRMKRVEVREETFEPGSQHREDRPVEENQAASADQGEFSAEIVFRIDRREAYRVYDRFEEEEITVLPQGDFEIRMQCPVDDWVYGLILSFGPAAVILEPDWAREELAARVRQMAKLYGG